MMRTSLAAHKKKGWRKMMKGKTLISIVALILFASLLFTIFYFVPFFAFSFGDKPKWYVVVIGFLRNNPLNVGKADDINILSMLANSFFWTFCIAVILYLLFYRKHKSIL